MPLNEEKYRYWTFRFYPLTAVMAAALLASKGFVYTGTGTGTESDDEVMCYFCEKRHRNWQIRDNIDEVHRRLSPNCPMVTGEACNNIPMVNLFENGFAQNEVESNSITLPQENQFTNQFESGATNQMQNTSQDETNQMQNTSQDETHSRPTSEPTTSVPTSTFSAENSVSANAEVIDSPTSAAPQRQSGIVQTHQPTYEELGIITGRPKRQELAIRSLRYQTFETDWPANHHLSVDDLCDAGFYFAGYGDCTRCFFCGGGLKNWDTNDNVWVEHARWFPRCDHMRQVKGQAFIAAVRRLNDEGRSEIPYDDVIHEMGTSAQVNSLENDPAVVAVLEMGCYNLQEVMQATEALKTQDQELSSALLLEKLSETCGWRIGETSNREDRKVSEEMINTLRPQIRQLRQNQLCKVCLDKEISVIYLPCGHFCSCSQCAATCEVCPVCRAAIRGMVRASMPAAPAPSDIVGNSTSLT